MDASPSTEPGLEALLACRIAAAAPGAAVAEEGPLYRLLAPRARRYGLRHLRDPHAAADLMQHVMALTLEQLRGGALRLREYRVPCNGSVNGSAAPQDDVLVGRLQVAADFSFGRDTL
ncbi:hypothetical protein [Azohydromonas lata]|uniref:hypothetical protein n=1 Tax=Azohydromonas lata TaxID=45677 RepID=UPI000835EF25|nr:hypothetical protein [Azohydromonas lata]